MTWRLAPIASSLLHGVRTAFANDPNAALHLISGYDPATLRWVRRECHGALVFSSDARLHRRLCASKLPAVRLALGPDWRPAVTEDHAAVGRMAAEHFLDRGYRQFGFVSTWRYPYAAARGQAFAQALSAVGRSVYTHTPPRTLDPRRLMNALDAWIAALPRPIAVFAVNDSLGLQVLAACRRLGVSVPHELAVVAAGNDLDVCSLSWPPLSSVAIPFERIGYEGAALLRRIIAGQADPDVCLVVPPQGVVTRQSSETCAVDDPVVARAIRFISEHACDPVSVRDVAEHVGYSHRRLLERFQRATGRSLHEQIRRVQLNRAMRLLDETAMPVRDVALACGWRDGKQIGRIFRQHLRLTPGDFRRRNRPPRADSPPLARALSRPRKSQRA